MSKPGVSGLSLHVPKLRVPLADWARWTGAAPDKIEAVVGRSFRVCGPGQSVYTMAAAAVLDLILRYEVDPGDVGMLALGTESSTDNAAGAVVVRGMIDDALAEMGRPRLSRACEVPELKHACLGGVYGMKAAARYLACDGRGRRAIVVSADIAEYERGSTGEQTQGAGAVAMLLDTDPTLFSIELDRAGSASAYRAIDFRKPFARHRADGYAKRTQRLHDFPVFNGKYSTVCYIDATVRALDAMFERIGGSRSAFFDDLALLVCHRPYQHMPQQAVAAMLVWSLARETSRHAELFALCDAARVDPAAILREVERSASAFDWQDASAGVEPYPAAMALAKHVRGTRAFKELVRAKMRLGEEVVRDLGNLYTASLPAWIGAAFEQAYTDGVDLRDRVALAMGYGSGDAAEAIPLRVVPGWERAAARLGFASALEDAIDLTREQYERIHDGLPVESLPDVRSDPFVVERVGDRVEGDQQDVGIEYYRFVRAAS